MTDDVEREERTISDALILADGDQKAVVELLQVDHDDVEQAWLRLYGHAPPVLRSSRSTICQWHRMQMLRNQAVAEGDTRAALKAEEGLRKLLAGRM